ncbi:MAG: hypothetical protein HXS41_01900 [Theionarchaea archaeon]|nr:hypothetical protein [Theionarchaea archaeon]MBU7019783.1 hypothetical protein [Theionarchaea archaeon]
MPKTRLDIGEKLSIEEEKVPARITDNQEISTSELYRVLHIFLSGFAKTLKPFTDEKSVEVAEMQWHLTLVPDGGAGILRAIASLPEFHLSPFYMLFNLKALSIVTGRLFFVEGLCSPGLSLQVVNHAQ